MHDITKIKMHERGIKKRTMYFCILREGLKCRIANIDTNSGENIIFVALLREFFLVADAGMITVFSKNISKG